MLGPCKASVVFKQQGKSTGLVTTVDLTDATPAAFGAHEASRDNRTAIAEDYFSDSQPNVLFGGDGPQTITGADAAAAGYTVVSNVDTMYAVAAKDHSVDSLVYGGFGNYDIFGNPLLNQGSLPLEADEQFAELLGMPRPYADLGMPHLSQMTQAALDILAQNDEGFFLMVESGNIDRQSHFAAINELVMEYMASVTGAPFPEWFPSISIITQEVIEFANAVHVAVDWAESEDLFGETLILVTADHETAGVVVTQDNGPGEHPDVQYTSDLVFYDGFPAYVHTAANVPIYAHGKNAVLFGTNPTYGQQVMDNSEIFARVLEPKSSFK